jgi:hypothetical protein
MLEGKLSLFPKKNFSMCECKLFLEVSSVCAKEWRLFAASAVAWILFNFNVFSLEVHHF